MCGLTKTGKWYLKDILESFTYSFDMVLDFAITEYEIAQVVQVSY